MATNVQELNKKVIETEKSGTGAVAKDEFLKGFVYEGITQDGRVKMPIDAPSEKELRRWLDEGHIEVVKIKKQVGSVSKGSKKVKPLDIANFVGQFASRKESAESDIEAIKSCAESTSNFALRYALYEVALRMENGMSPEEAFDASYIYNAKKKKHTERKTFPKEMIYSIQAGKRGDAILLLKNYETRLKASVESKKEAITELIYPVITIVVSMIAVGVMVFYVIPQFIPLYEGMFTGKDAQLPLLTRIVMGISNFATSLSGIAVMGSIVGVIGYAVYWATRTEKGKTWRQERELFLPALPYLNPRSISNLIVLYMGYVHLTSLGQVMKATDLVTALRETAAGSPHVVYARIFNTMADTIEARGSYFAPVGRPYSHILGKDFFALLETGSKGDMSEQVLKLADQLGAEFQTQIKRMLKLITPATGILLGLIIGTLVISMYYPMIDMVGKMAGK